MDPLSWLRPATGADAVSIAAYLRAQLGSLMSQFYADLVIGALFALLSFALAYRLLKYLWQFARSLWSVGSGLLGSLVSALALALVLLLLLEVQRLSREQFPAEHEATIQTVWLGVGACIKLLTHVGNFLVRGTVGQ